MAYKDPPLEHQWKPGESGNPNGRPKGTLKDYVRQKLSGMTEEEKDKFLKDIPNELQWRMAEGNPAQDNKISGDSENPVPILILNNAVLPNNSNKQNNTDDRKDTCSTGRNISIENSKHSTILDSTKSVGQDTNTN